MAVDGVWSAERTSPAEIEEGLRGLLQERHAADSASAAARVLNLVAVVDRERREEIDKRLAQVGRYHPSRTIICVVEPGSHHPQRAGHLDRHARPAARRARPVP